MLKKAIVILVSVILFGIAGYCIFDIFQILGTYREGREVYTEVSAPYLFFSDPEGDTVLPMQEMGSTTEGSEIDKSVRETIQETSQAAYGEVKEEQEPGEYTDEEIQAIVKYQAAERSAGTRTSGFALAQKEEPYQRTLRIKYLPPLFTWDYMRMHSEYPDVVGYIYQKDHMSYPILKGKTNDTYVRTMINGQYNILGSIFEDSGRNLWDHYTVIYGHNVKDGQMFGSLISYRDPAYLRNNSWFDLYDGMLHYRYYVYAVCTTPVDTDVFSYGLNEEEKDLATFAAELKEKSDYPVGDYGLGPVTDDDYLVCLSTCTYDLNYAYRYTIILRRAFRYQK